MDRRLRGLGVVQRNVVLQLGHPEAMKRATQDGLGVALLFRSAVQQELRVGTLVRAGGGLRGGAGMPQLGLGTWP